MLEDLPLPHSPRCASLTKRLFLFRLVCCKITILSGFWVWIASLKSECEWDSLFSYSQRHCKVHKISRDPVSQARFISLLKLRIQGDLGRKRRLLVHQVVAVWLLSCVQLLVTPWTVARQAPMPMGFPRQEYWSGLPFPSRGIGDANSHRFILVTWTTNLRWGPIVLFQNAVFWLLREVKVFRNLANEPQCWNISIFWSIYTSIYNCQMFRYTVWEQLRW